MAAYQYVYHMQGVSKTYPGGKKCFENIHLSFLPGVKIGVVGVNGAGKSTLMKIMAGLDKDFFGEAWSAEGAKVGYLPQEPELDSSKNVRENVMLGVAPKPFKVICGDMSFPFVIGRLRERSATIPDGTVKDKAFCEIP